MSPHTYLDRPKRLALAAPFGVSALAALALAAPAWAGSQHLGERVLQQGMSGHDVRVLQDYLTRAGFSTPVVGTFGAVTFASVERFERRYHLKVDGVVSAAVVRELRLVTAPKQKHAAAVTGSGGGDIGGASATNPAAGGSSSAGMGSGHLGSRTLSKGMSGHDVRVLQDFLTRAGYPTPIAGVFGPTTLQNVKDFESGHGLPADGVVSKTVAAALRAAVAKAEKVNSGPVGKAHLNADGTVTPPANAPAVIRNVIAAANRIAFKPYIYGGGHATWNDSGYDCSGSVSYALHGGNLISAPEDSGELESYGTAGPGQWITIWANAGHTYMYVAGLRFDTSAQGSTGGSRWTSQPRSNDGFVERHPTGH